MSAGAWPAALTPVGLAIVNGASGAVVKQSGGIFGTFSHPATGNCRVELNMAGIAETADNLAVVVTSNDAGGGAGDTRIPSYGINSGVTPPVLNVYTRDAAGALIDAGRLSIAVYLLP